MPTDQYFLLVFDQSSSGDLRGVMEGVRARAAAVPALCKVVRGLPGELDTPVWVRDSTLAETGVRAMAEASIEWSECLRRVSGLLAESLDPDVQPWTLHVARDVQGCPQVSGPATVVLARLNHAITDAGGGAALMRALFSPAPEDADLHVADESRSDDRVLARFAVGVLGLLRRTVLVPLAVARFLRGARRAGFGSTSDPGRVVFNGPTGRTRHLTVLPVPDDLGEGSEYTKTQLALAAISLAMQRYVERSGEHVEDLLTQVTVRIRDTHRWHGVNQFLPARISLAPHLSDARDRLRHIAQALRGERDRLDDPRVVAFYRLNEAVPVPVMSRLDRMATPAAPEDSPVVAHATMTSVDCGDGKLELGGGTLRFICGFPYLSPTIGLGHGLYGAGGTLTVGVLSSPESLPEPDEYAALLAAALDEVAALT